MHSAVVTWTFEKDIVPGTYNLIHVQAISLKSTSWTCLKWLKFDLPSHDLVGENIIGHLSKKKN